MAALGREKERGGLSGAWALGELEGFGVEDAFLPVVSPTGERREKRKPFGVNRVVQLT